MPVFSRSTAARSAYFDVAPASQDTTRRAIRGAGATVLCSLSTTVLQTGSSFILARLLSPQDFGRVAMVLYVSLLLQNFGVNGFTEAIIQADTLDHRQVSTLFWINAGISALLVIAMAAASPLIAHFYREPQIASIAVVMSLSILFTGLSTEHLALLKRNMAFYKTAANDLAANAFSLLLAILLAWHGWGYWALAARWVTLPMLSMCGAWVLCSWRPGLPDFSGNVRPLVKFAFHAYGNFGVDFFRRNLDKILIGRFCGSIDLGNYDRAYQMFGLPASSLMSPLTTVALSALSKLRHHAETFRQQYLKSVALVALPGMLMTAVLTLIGQDLIVLLLGPRWLAAGRIFTMFCPALGMLMLYSTHGWLHLSLGRADRWFYWGAASLAVTAAILAIGIFFGPTGVAVSYAVSLYLLLGPALSFAGRPVNLPARSVFQVTWKFFASAALSYAACRLLLAHAPVLSNAGLLARCAFSGSLCTVLYVAAVVVLYRSTSPLHAFIRFAKGMVMPSQRAVSQARPHDRAWTGIDAK